MQEAPKIDSRSEGQIFHALVQDLKKPERLGIDADGEEPIRWQRRCYESFPGTAS